MKISPHEGTPSKPVEMEGAEGCAVRWLIDENDGAPNFAMRQFEVAPGGHTPQHHHPYEHEVFVLEGSGEVLEGQTPHALKAGDVVFVAPNETHQFRNTGNQPLKFICLVPNSAGKGPAVTRPECDAGSSEPGTE